MAEGLDVRRLEELDAYYRDSIGGGRLQGASYLIAQDDVLLAHRAWGRRTYKEGSPDLEPDDIGELFEMTMLFTATAVMQLAEQGRIRLDRPVAELLPAFDRAYYREITPFHLLTHTSGLAAHPHECGEAYTGPHFDWHPYYKGGGWLDAVLSGPLLHRPGERCVFSSAGYAVLGAAVEAASGMRHEDYVRENILRPLRMDHTYYTIPEEWRDRTAHSFDWQAWGIYGGGDSRAPQAYKGLYSTLPDLWRFARAMLNGGELDGARILGEDSCRLMTTNRLSGVQRFAYGRTIEAYRAGFGWNLVNEPEEPEDAETYSFGNSQCGLYIDPRERLIHIFFAPNTTWNFEEANGKPRVILHSMLRRAPAAERLSAYLGERVEDGRLQGAGFLLSRDGEVLAERAFGRLRPHPSSGPLTAESPFFVSSLTKLITAIAVLQLEEAGKLSLSQPVKEWLPEFDNAQHGAIELGHLLAHTSGLSPEPGLDGEPNPSGWWENLFLFGWEPPEENRSKWIRAILAGPLRGVPGRDRRYSTAGYTLLGEIVSRASGERFERYAAERIFAPLGMASTFFDVPESRREETCAADEWQEQLLYAPEPKPAEPPRSGAGLYSTLRDLGKLGQALLGGAAAADGAGGGGGSACALSPAVVGRLRELDFADVPGFAWTPRQAASFPCGPHRYPARQMDFPMPRYHDVNVSCGLIVNPSERIVIVLHVPGSARWSPEPLACAKRIAAGGGW